MGELQSLQRLVNPCPSFDYREHKKYFPNMDLRDCLKAFKEEPADTGFMPLVDPLPLESIQHMCFYVRTLGDVEACDNIDEAFLLEQGFSRNEPYIDLYIFPPLRTKPRRYMIRKGYALPADLEEEFLAYIKVKELVVGNENFIMFKQQIKEAFPEIHMCDYGIKQIGMMLEHIYYAMHYSGPKEILYKANLSYLAYHYDQVDEQVVASFGKQKMSPKTLFDMPTRLIKIMNHPRLVEFMHKKKDREYSKMVYQRYHTYVTENTSAAQWKYLCDLYKRKNVPFNRTIYRRLEGCDEAVTEMGYMIFLESREKVCDEFKSFFQKIPTRNCLGDELAKLDEVRECIQKEEKYDKKLDTWYSWAQRFEYEDDTYIFKVPQTTREIITEALQQRNCLMDHIRSVCSGDETLVFVRKKNDPTASYMTFALLDNYIIEAYGTANRFLNFEEYLIMDRYRKAKQLKFSQCSFNVELYDECLEVNPDFCKYVDYFEEMEKSEKQRRERELQDSDFDITLEDMQNTPKYRQMTLADFSAAFAS